MKEYLENIISDHNTTVEKFFTTVCDHEILKDLVDKIEQRIDRGGKLIVFGNGGSATDASHFVGELVGRFEKERKAIPAISLGVDPATVTAIANDYGYENVFSRQVEAFVNSNDILIGITTSGSSKNIIKAFEKSKENHPRVLNIMLTSDRCGMVSDASLVDHIIKVPNNRTCVIQEVHIMFLHVLAQLIEERF